MAFSVRFPLIIFLAVVSLAACKQSEPKKQLVKVKVSPIISERHRTALEYVGRLEAVNDTSIQAQVSGYLKSANFIEGDFVNEGDLLFVIDPSSYETELTAAKAKVAQAKALAEEANLNYKRGQKIIKSGAISRSEMDKLTAKLHSTEADLKNAQANEKSAEINLTYTQITAPFSGRVGRKALSIGDLVSPNSKEPLTTLVSIHPIYAVFQINAKTYSTLAEKNRQAVANGQSPKHFTARLRLSSDQIYEEVGKFDFISNRIDADTDTITIRASFPNPNGILKPGQYVRVIAESDQEHDVLTVPQSAIVSNQEGELVYVVDTKNIVHTVLVETGQNMGTRTIVSSEKLKAGDKVIIAGMQKVKSGQEVDIIPTKKDTKKISD